MYHNPDVYLMKVELFTPNENLYTGDVLFGTLNTSQLRFEYMKQYASEFVRNSKEDGYPFIHTVERGTRIIEVTFSNHKGLQKTLRLTAINTSGAKRVRNRKQHLYCN